MEQSFVTYYILVCKEKNLDVRTTKNLIRTINPRLSDLFDYFQLTEMSDSDIETHMYQYFKGSIFEEHSDG